MNWRGLHPRLREGGRYVVGVVLLLLLARALVRRDGDPPDGAPRVEVRFGRRDAAHRDAELVHGQHLGGVLSGPAGRKDAPWNPCSSRLAFRVDGHRGHQQPRKREKRYEISSAREGRGDLRGDGGDQHAE